ncbi:MAG: beta-lactamase family protein [Clostridiales bacterium]|jgi:CubicO group peptidase (beta-lactamase class C family)|nr:beta-lactamase family protein [Clostridiales bacterium]
MSDSSFDLLRAGRPEDVGVSSKALVELVDDYEKSGMEMHSFLVMRHGKVAFEYYRAPYNAETPHSVNSFSKSVASTAVGFAIDEGLFGLDSKLYELFPEYKITKKSALKYSGELTVRHVLTMTTGKTINVAKDKSRFDWVEDFLNSPSTYKPGTHFHYTNENAYMLSALIQKLTGQNLVDYLMPRLFEPLGIDRPVWETDQNGVAAGGFGLYLKTRDGAKIMQCYLDGGKYQGKQVIPEFWAREATTRQTSNDKNCKPDSKVGYGYQFWMCTVPNTFAGRGMFGQQGVVMRDQDACFFYTGSDADEQKPMTILFRHFPEGFKDGIAFDEAAYAELRAKTDKLDYGVIPAAKRSPLEDTLKASRLKFRKQLFLNAMGMPTSFLPLTITNVSIAKHGTIDNVKFEFKENELILKWYEKDVYNEIPLGLDGNYRYGKINLPPFEFTSVGYAYWERPDKLTVHFRPLEAIASRTFSFEFKKDGRVKIIQGSTPTAKSIIDNIALLAEAFIDNAFIYFFAKRMLKAAPFALEPKMRARVVKEK